LVPYSAITQHRLGFVAGAAARPLGTSGGSNAAPVNGPAPGRGIAVMLTVMLGPLGLIYVRPGLGLSLTDTAILLALPTIGLAPLGI
jgi:hypothetical protein